MSEKKLSILWYSNSSVSNSGYGKQTKYILAGLHSRGYRADLSPNFGGSGQGKYSLDGYYVWPQGPGLSEAETIEHYKRQGYDVLVSLYDHWVLTTMSDLVRRNRVVWCPYIPIDMTFIPHRLGEILSAATYLIPFCHYGESLLKRVGFENVYKPIYHGVDCDVYKPLSFPKEKMRTWLGFKNESFVISIFKMNKGDRVKIQASLEAIKIFLENNLDLMPEVGIYLHCVANSPQGADLRETIKSLGLENKVRFADPYAYFVGLSEEEMSRAYNASDLVLNCTSSEGFGTNIIESMACGVPVLATDCMSMTELLKPITPELLVKTKTEYWTLQATKQFEPDVNSIADKIETVLNTDPKQYKKKLAKYARNKFGWDKIINEWVEFFEFLPLYIDEKCLMVPQTTSRYLKRLSRKVEVYE